MRSKLLNWALNTVWNSWKIFTVPDFWHVPRQVPNFKAQLTGRQLQAIKHKPPTFRHRGKAR